MRSSHQSEGERLDRKSLRLVTGKRADFVELAEGCVCFANGAGGQILIHIEDADAHLPPDQRIDSVVLDRIRKRVGELTVNVEALPELRKHDNGGEYVALTVRRAVGGASTCDGRFFLRVGDTCQPVVGDDVLRLANDRPSTQWELMTTLGVPRAAADVSKVGALVGGIREAESVKGSGAAPRYWPQGRR